MDLDPDLNLNEVFRGDIYKYVQEEDQTYIVKSYDRKRQTPRAKIGLTTNQANQRFVAILTDVLRRAQGKASSQTLFRELLKTDIVLNLISFALLLGSLVYTILVYNEDDFICQLWEHVIQVVFLIPWIMLNIYVKILLKINKLNRKANRIGEILAFLKLNMSMAKQELEHKNYNLDPPSSDFVSVYRNFEWVRIPRNVLVKGDVFKLHVNQIFPCDCKLIVECENEQMVVNDHVYRQGERCVFVGSNTKNEQFIDGTFLALSDSFTSYLEFYLNCPEREEAWNGFYGLKRREELGDPKEVIWNYNDNYIFLNYNNKIVIVLIILLTLILHIFWNFMYTLENKVVIVLNLARLILLLDFVGFEPLYKLSELWGNVKLLSVFEIYHEHRFLKDLDPVRSISSSSFLTDSSFDSVSSDLLVDEITFSFQFRQISRVLKKGLFGEHSLISQLNCITLLSFIDDIGILLNSNQSLQEISIITPSRTTVMDMIEAEGAKEPGAAAGGQNPEPPKEGEDDLLILDVFNDINLYGKDNIRFTNEYEKNCRNLLKPLIFSMSLTSLPSYLPIYNYSMRKILKKRTISERDGTAGRDCVVNLGESNSSVHFNPSNLVNRGHSSLSNFDHLAEESRGRVSDLVLAATSQDKPQFRSMVSGGATKSLSREQAWSDLKDPEEEATVSKIWRNSLYKNYISTLINRELDSFNNCLCTLTNVLGIKKLYLKRYKLLKFVLFNFKPFLELETPVVTERESNRDPVPSGALSELAETVNISLANSSNSSSPGLTRKRREEERVEADNKILIYFYRDTNKKIVQMIIKCNISIINNYKLNYFNGRTINPLNKSIKRKIRDLNIQWLSNGMNTFLYFYKPISVNDFNIFQLILPYITVYNVSTVNSVQTSKEKNKLIKRNNRKYMYMYKNNALYYKYKGVNNLQLAKLRKSPVSPTSTAENKQTMTKDVILGSYIGEMLNSYIKNSILLGMAATKYNLPKEISNRINDLHDAGIRFVYFSKHNEKVTRIIGGLLGLETSWNSMISLSTSETSSFINQEGHTVLPNGIDHIRQHIQQVDDIPLQVSLYCNCNCDNIVEMLDILNENGERIMCIGSGLNPNNFHLFNNSHVSFSISLNYSPICKFCKGKRWQGISKAHIFEEPMPEFKLSSLITSLTSSLQTTQLYKVSDPDFIFQMLYELFKEARKISTNLQESISFMLLCYYSLVWMFFLQQLLSLPPLFSTFDFSMIVFVYIPYLSLTLISNPIMDKIMEHLPNKNIKRDNITFTHYVRTYLRLLVMCFFMVLVYYIHIYYANLHINNKLNLSNRYCTHFFYYPRYTCVDDIVSHLKRAGEYKDAHVAIVLSQNFTSISFVVFLVASSLSWIQMYSYINMETFTNVKWIIASLIILATQIGVVAVKVFLMDLRDWKLVRLMIVNTSYSLLLTIPIILVDQVMKFFTIKNKNTQQKFLQLLFSTRLGTWSPK